MNSNNNSEEFARSKPCPNDCGTRILHDPVFDKMDEFRTKEYHGPARCAKIKAIRMAERLNPKSKFRENSIENINKIIEEKVPKVASEEEKLFIILSNIQSPEEYPTVYEFVASLHPNHIFVDTDSLKKDSTSFGKGRINNTLHRIRKRIENEYCVPFATRNRDTGNFHYSDILTEDELRPVKDRLNRVDIGITDTIGKSTRIVCSDPEERQRARERLQKYYESIRKGRNNNSNDEDKS